LTWIIDGSEWLASRLGRFFLWEKKPRNPFDGRLSGNPNTFRNKTHRKDKVKLHAFLSYWVS
jgi:hypothetical protein